VSHVPNLLPAEILILLGIIFAILVKIACMIYRAQKKETARTRLIMEIGNGTDTIMLPVMELPYLAKHYRIKLSRSRMAFQLIDTKFGANLSWMNGVQLTNAVLEMSVPLPPWIFALSSPSSTFCGNQNSVKVHSPLFGRVSFAQNATGSVGHTDNGTHCASLSGVAFSLPPASAPPLEKY